MVTTREFEDRDWPAVWSILKPIFRAGETYAVPPDISEADARLKWTSPPNRVFVAEDARSGGVLGTYFITRNYDGPGDHVCNCGYAVSVSARGKGIATLMCQDSQDRAASQGFRAMQFNLVAASNAGAVRLWGKLGFDIVGTLPGAFRDPQAGFVDAHVMFKRLSSTAQLDDAADDAAHRS